MGTEINISLPEMDQCPELERKIDEAWKEKESKELPRPYLGISIIGHPCNRYLWLQFRWAVIEEKEGRIYRLLDMGDREEDIAAENLRMAGLKLAYTGDNQMDIDFGGGVKGHPDGLILSGVPGAEATEHIWEHKTMNAKNFSELEKKGLKEAKPMHYAQIQCGMFGTKLFLGHQVKRGLYQVICKDDSRLYFERVRFDKAFAEEMIERGRRICKEERIPHELSDNPSWWQCKICPCSIFCHVSNETEEINCRTCAHSTPREDGSWYCEYYKDTIPLNFQYKGCEAHCFHPDLVPWELDANRSTEFSGYYITDKERGIGYLNGADGITSKNLKERVKRDYETKGVSAERDNVSF